MVFSRETKLYEIEEAFPDAKGCFISGGDFFEGDKGRMTLGGLQEEHPTWFSGDIIYGLERLNEVADDGRKYVYEVYPGDQTAEDPRLGTIRMLFLPAKEKKHDLFAVLAAGGGYGAVCTLAESLPVAVKLNELGITCFCVNYRTADVSSFGKGLMPEPVDDLAAAISYILENRTEFGITSDDYFAGGFSAGAHLVSQWGTAHLGAHKYGLPNARMLILVYPLITLEHIPEGPVKNMLCEGMFGKGYTLEDIRLYDASLHVHSGYPKTFITRSRDDDTIKDTGLPEFMNKLDSHGIACIYEEGESGGHGFGLGSATPLKGWPERAVSFLFN